MPDAWTETFDRQFGGGSSDPGVPSEADPWLKKFDSAFGATKAATKKGLKFAGDIVGPPARFLGSALEFPVAAAAKYGLGTDVPLEFSPEAGMKQFESPQGRQFLENVAGPLPPFTPAGADIAANLAMTGPMNLVGKAVLMPLARAGLEPLRGLPVIKEALEFSKTGAGLPSKYREYVQGLLRTEEGKADLRAFLREKQFGDAIKLPTEVQERIGHAIETKTIDSLSPDEQGLANALLKEYASIPRLRREAGGRAHELARTSRLGFIPRIERTGRQRYVEQAPAFGTNPGQARTELGRELTSRQMGGDYVPSVKAALMHGERADTKIMRLGIVGDLVKKYGQPSSYAESLAKTHEGIATGFSPEMQKLLQSRKLPPELTDFVGRLNKRLQPEEFGRLSRAMQWVNQGFKKWALFSPGYTSRNLQNNVFQILMFEGDSPADIAKLAQAVPTVAKPTPEKVQEWIKLGVVGRGQTAREIGKGGGLTGLARGLNTQVEDKSRAMLYELRLLKGDSPEKAASRVDDLLFNYSQRFASRARRDVGRKYVPFVNWSAFIPGLTARTFLERPGSVALASNLRDRQNRSQGYTDERLAKEFGPWNLPQGVVATGQGVGFVPQFAGQYSVNDWVPTSATNALDKLLSKVYPTIGTPAQLGTGRQGFTSQTLQYKKDQEMKDRFTTAPSSMRLIFSVPGGQQFAAKHGITLDKETGKVIAPARLVLVLKSFPQSRIFDLIADYAAGVKGKEATALSFGAGVRPVTRYEPKKR